MIFLLESFYVAERKGASCLIVMISNIRLILILIILLSIVDLIDDPLLLHWGLRDEGIEEFLFETGCFFVEITLIFRAFLLGKKLIFQSKEKEKHYRRLIDLSPEAFFVRREGKIIYANKASVTLLGANSVADLLNRDWEKLLNFDSYNPEHLSRKKLKNKKEKVLSYQIRGKRLDGKVIDLEIISTNVEYEGLPAREIIARDITTRKKQELIVKQLAYQDALTELPNRRAFLDQLEKLLIDAQKDKTTFAVMMVDLDGFKEVNDSGGHEEGDNLLKQVSVSLKKSVRKNDTVARLGGDEFTILLPKANQQDCIVVANRIMESLNFPIEQIDKSLRVTPSIGIALYPQNGIDSASLLKQADMAMYQAKNNGKNSYKFAE